MFRLSASFYEIPRHSTRFHLISPPKSARNALEKHAVSSLPLFIAKNGLLPLAIAIFFHYMDHKSGKDLNQGVKVGYFLIMLLEIVSIYIEQSGNLFLSSGSEHFM